jgi:hypothetical protein
MKESIINASIVVVCYNNVSIKYNYDTMRIKKIYNMTFNTFIDCNIIITFSLQSSDMK